jgi:hypothetical protein
MVSSERRSSRLIDEDDGLLERAGRGAGLGLDVEEVLAAEVKVVVSAEDDTVIVVGGKLKLEMLVAALQTWGLLADVVADLAQ